MKEAKQTTLYELVANSRFTIPKYQRTYQWEESQVHDFVDDIMYLLDTHGGDVDIDHYFGTLVLGALDDFDWSRSNSVQHYEVIDGQQRLTTTSVFMSQLAAELSLVGEKLDDESASQEAEEVVQDIKSTYVGQSRTENFVYRLSPGERASTVYKHIVRSDLETRDLDTDDLSARRLTKAKAVITSRMHEWRLEHISVTNLDDADQDHLLEYLEHLFDVASVVNNRLIVTKNVVDSIDSAARMFKVINERGKNLSIFDRVKSHIVYCATQCDSHTVDVSKRMKDAAEIITSEPNTSERTVDEYVNIHWTIWTSDYPARRRSRGLTVCDLIQEQNRFADPNRDDIRQWIENYAETFYQLSEHYIELRDPEKFRANHDSDDWRTHYVADRLYGIKNCNTTWLNYLPPLIATKDRFGAHSDEFIKLITAMDSLAFRYHHVMKGRGSIESHMGKGAYQIFWAEIDNETVRDLFNGNPILTLDDTDQQQAVTDLTETVSDAIQERCNDELFEEYLTEDDLIQGSSRNNWAGIRHSEKSVKYILYEYEKHLRGVSNIEIPDMKPITEWADEHLVEYVVHDDRAPEDVLLPTKKIGNIAVISKDVNLSTRKKPLQNKRSLYADSDVVMLNELSNANIPWDENAIEDRTQDIVEMAKKRWPEEPTVQKPSKLAIK